MTARGARAIGLDMADLIRLAGDGMSWEDTMRHIDETLAAGEGHDLHDYPGADPYLADRYEDDDEVGRCEVCNQEHPYLTTVEQGGFGSYKDHCPGCLNDIVEDTRAPECDDCLAERGERCDPQNCEGTLDRIESMQSERRHGGTATCPKCERELARTDMVQPEDGDPLHCPDCADATLVERYPRGARPRRARHEDLPPLPGDFHVPDDLGGTVEPWMDPEEFIRYHADYFGREADPTTRDNIRGMSDHELHSYWQDLEERRGKDPDQLAEERQRSRDRARELADGLWNAVFPPEGEEERRSVQNIDTINNLMASGWQPGHIRYDEDDEPYALYEHPSGWTVKDHGGVYKEIGHAATPGEAHDVINVSRHDRDSGESYNDVFGPADAHAYIEDALRDDPANNNFIHHLTKTDPRIRRHKPRQAARLAGDGGTYAAGDDSDFQQFVRRHTPPPHPTAPNDDPESPYYRYRDYAGLPTKGWGTFPGTVIRDMADYRMPDDGLPTRDRMSSRRRLAKDGGCTCWEGYERVPGTEPCSDGSCRKKTGSRDQLDDLTQRKALNLVKGWMARYLGHDEDDVPSGQRAYESGSGLRLHPTWKASWQDPITGEMHEESPVPAVIHEGYSGWADDASFDENLNEGLRQMGVQAENWYGNTLTLHPLPKPFTICQNQDCVRGYDIDDPACPDCGTPNHRAAR